MNLNEKFYVRNNITHRWTTKDRGVLTSFSSQRTAKRYADNHLDKFTIVSFNTGTRKLKWRGGERALSFK